jgi:hypothetical protein
MPASENEEEHLNIYLSIWMFSYVLFAQLTLNANFFLISMICIPYYFSQLDLACYSFIGFFTEGLNLSFSSFMQVFKALNIPTSTVLALF